jgi:hypothetical protein
MTWRQETIDQYLQQWWSQFPNEVLHVVSDDIWARHADYQASGIPLALYVNRWAKERGTTKSLPDDVSFAFFERMAILSP